MKKGAAIYIQYMHHPSGKANKDNH